MNLFSRRVLATTILLLSSVPVSANSAGSSCESSRAPLKVILDCDPGADDAFAILWLAALSKKIDLQLLAVTSASGNVSPMDAFRNAVHLLNVTGLSDANPVLGRSSTEDDFHEKNTDGFHGGDGLHGTSALLQADTDLVASNALVADMFSAANSSERVLVEVLSRWPSQVTILTMGPLSNLAKAEYLSPGILSFAKAVVTMAGALDTSGNVSPLGEFNAWYDALATHKVLQSLTAASIKPVLFPLAVTESVFMYPTHLELMHQFICSRMHADNATAMRSSDGDCLDELSARGKVIGRFMEALMQTMFGNHMAFGYEFGMHMHDSCVVSYLAYPFLFSFQSLHLEVNAQNGHTFADRRLYFPSKPPNAWVSVTVEAHTVLKLFLRDVCAMILSF